MSNGLPYLELLHAKHGRRFALNRPSMVIGRSVESDIVLPFPQVSRRHARVFSEGDQFVVEDLGSANGVTVNQVPVRRKVLQHGDEISLGAFRLLFFNSRQTPIRLSDEYLTDPNMTISFPVAERGIEARGKAGPDGRQANEMAAIILNAAKSLLSSHDLNTVLSGVMDLVFEYLHADRGFLMLYNPETQDLVPCVIKVRSSPESASGKEGISFSRTIVNKVFREGMAVLTANAMCDERFDAKGSVVLQQIHSCMCVPLWDEKKVKGIVYVDSRFRENVFQEKDLDLLSTIAIISAIAIDQSQLREAVERERHLREQLERYHSPAVVNRILRSGKQGFRVSEEKEISVLFADLTAFTSLTEKLEPQEAMNRVNTFLSAMTDVIFQNEGTLDKYIGDAVMAVFGAPFSQEDHARRAVRTALEMFRALEEINRIHSFPDPLRMRIGINSGRVIAGDVGSEKRLEYTVMGNSVNIAFRIENQIAQADEIIIGESTKEKIGDLFPTVSLGSMPLKGIEQPLRLYRILQDAPRPGGSAHGRKEK